MAHNGSCLCKGVQYTVTGDPVTTVLCHCPDCGAFSGTGFMWNAWYSEENFEITAGADLLTTYTNLGRFDPLNTVDRQFCKICGSSVIVRAPRRPQRLVFVAVGTLLGELGPEFSPKQEFYCIFRNKWLSPVEGATLDTTDWPSTKLTFRTEDPSYVEGKTKTD